MRRAVVYTDGAASSSGQLAGLGGWAWVNTKGPYAAGFSRNTTNQRMEMRAVLEACMAHPEGPLTIVTDSAYVANCWRDGWWTRWVRNGWKSSKGKPVKNRDLWTMLLPHLQRPELVIEHVRGHSGDTFNEIADQLAVAAKTEQRSQIGYLELAGAR